MMPPELPPFEPQPAVELAPEPPPHKPGAAFWDYQDLAIFICLSTVSLFAALLLVRFFPPGSALPIPYRLLAGQLIWYVLMFGILAAILRMRYNRPFWPSLGWFTPRWKDAISSLAMGPVLAIALGLFLRALQPKQIPLPFERMLQNEPLVILFGVVVVIVGPICEELAFRGFMMPLFVRSVGPAAGIIIAGLLFGALHGFEYPDWRYVATISIAGFVFGWRRHTTGSTVNSALLHGAFNLTQFAAFLAQQHLQQV